MEDVSINKLNKHNGDTVTEKDFNIIDDNFEIIKNTIEYMNINTSISTYFAEEW
ncbi:hypothetical protein psyc5s11_36600 [Clostridium gelidum]|uniref:Uncharacterized protein n=1 Tax=Clostridium gelidum TaxID=704125 RepID=A0ABN6J1G9_9CLOT|nr:hypothetical protein [Clostridium gelidum]BCZ47593.1 hypothetical protein psyc5s11_36600 [Clostridium gelidum]